MFATADIPIQTFICEYKTTVVYSNPATYQKLQNEYIINNEPCKVVEAKLNGKRYWFDATRRLNQFGAYANHAVHCNSKLLPPVMVRNKLRIGLLSIRNIQKGEEVTWDYADRNPNFPWLSRGKFCVVIVISTNSNRQANIP